MGFIVLTMLIYFLTPATWFIILLTVIRNALANTFFFILWHFLRTDFLDIDHLLTFLGRETTIFFVKHIRFLILIVEIFVLVEVTSRCFLKRWLIRIALFCKNCLRRSLGRTLMLFGTHVRGPLLEHIVITRDIWWLMLYTIEIAHIIKSEQLLFLFCKSFVIFAPTAHLIKSIFLETTAARDH